ncbi:MAG: response regulator [Desulfobulbaceae bacterium]|nr:response regulator [Desulfobulbaceae bacterium]
MGRLKHIVLTGAGLLDQGVTDFDRWSEEMIRKFGTDIEPHLEDIRLSSQELRTSFAANQPSPAKKLGRRLFMTRNVLVVDDEPNIVLSLKFLISQQGYEVRTAGSGEEALHALNEQIPDLILLDIMMPKPDGYEVCQIIRSTPEWKDIPVIMLTAKGRDVEKQKGFAMGADDYITKPFSTLELVTKVRAMLKEKK